MGILARRLLHFTWMASLRLGCYAVKSSILCFICYSIITLLYFNSLRHFYHLLTTLVNILI
jgi:hypothetical protein